MTLLAIDQGTTGSTSLLLDDRGRTLGRATVEFPQHYPEPGWVEHEPEEIWQSVIDSVGEAIKRAGVASSAIAAVGITNQRETTLLWERATGRPVERAIVWQDRRTAGYCARLKAEGVEPVVRKTTGLVLDPYFSGTKLAWLLERDPSRRAAAEAGQLAFGTVDSYLVFRLAGGAGAGAPHVTDVTNASRTLLMNLETRRWDPAMCELLSVPSAVLPKIVPSAGIVAVTRQVPGLPDGIPIAGMAGDQHAALFGQACLAAGDAKCTYGTGAFLLVNTGPRPVASAHGLLSTMAWQIGDEPAYALEGSVFVAGAAVQWLRDGLGVITKAAEVEGLARSVPASDGVVFVPALSGLGAPYWDPGARGLVSGITRGTTKAHLARATLEAIALQVDDLVRAMRDDTGLSVDRMRVDGGASANDLLMELQAGISGTIIERPTELETTARGAAMLAGIGSGVFRNAADAAERAIHLERSFAPELASDAKRALRARWDDAVRRTRS